MKEGFGVKQREGKVVTHRDEGRSRQAFNTKAQSAGVRRRNKKDREERELLEKITHQLVENHLELHCVCVCVCKCV